MSKAQTNGKVTSNPAGSDELPEGWAAATLGAVVADVQPGFACGVNNRDGNGVPHLRPMNVNIEGEIDLCDVKFVPEDKVDSDRRWLRKGDVLFNNTNSTELVGKTAFYGHDEPRAFSNHMTRVRVHADTLDATFCAAYLHQCWRDGHFQEVCNQHVSQSSVSRTRLLETLLLLPPLAEQARIVAKVEALLERVRKASERLARVPDLLRRFRQSVLAAACSGQLTADWRDKNAIGDSAALINKIRNQHKGRYEANNSTRYRSPLEPQPDREYEHPEEWSLTSMDQLTCLVTSGSRGWAKYYSDDGPLFVRAQNINTDELCLNDAAHVTPPDSAEGRRTRVQQNDLLITITGANVTKSAIVRDDIGEGYVSQHVAIVRPVDQSVSPYLYLWIISPSHGRAKLTDDAYGAGKPGINLTNIRDMPVALPSLVEQQEIVGRVTALLALADQIEQRISTATSQTEKNTQSILAKAFAGELVETEAALSHREARDYEPASVLLERIAAERGATITGKPKRTRKSKTKASSVAGKRGQ